MMVRYGQAAGPVKRQAQAVPFVAASDAARSAPLANCIGWRRERNRDRTFPTYDQPRVAALRHQLAHGLLSATACRHANLFAILIGFPYAALRFSATLNARPLAQGGGQG